MILITGGSGLLGTELKKLLPDSLTPSSKELDVTDINSINYFFDNNEIDLVIHCAAYMPPTKSDEFPDTSIETNIIGTCLLTNRCISEDIGIIYISTDYVFKGDKGNYNEDDSVLPCNNYARSKLGGECAVLMHNKGLVIRTSFGPKEFPYDNAFINQWTSKQSVDVIAKKIVKLIGKGVYGVIHIGGKRKTIYDYATSISPDKKIGAVAMRNDGYIRPSDTSLNVDKYKSIVGEEDD